MQKEIKDVEHKVPIVQYDKVSIRCPSLKYESKIVQYGNVSVRCPRLKRFLIGLYGSYGCIECEYHSCIGL